MNYRILQQNTPAEIYRAALTYGQYLWQQALPARAILAVNRALQAPVEAHDPVLQEHPLPYHALAWMFLHHGDRGFLGNPRISFQHQAHRLRGRQEALRKVRCWAVWHLATQALPELPDDFACPRPLRPDIVAGLQSLGHPGESDLWEKASELCPSTKIPQPLPGENRQ